jgi:ferric-dicitrate binding protein FerR (iron transport regulator)
MSNRNPAKTALPYIQRALEDEFVQEQLRDAVSGARAAYLRARKRRSQAVEDKRLYRSLRQAATAIRNATSALQPPKRPPKRRRRNAMVVAAAITATALLTIKLQKAQSHSPEEAGASPPPPEAYGATETTPPPAA